MEAEVRTGESTERGDWVALAARLLLGGTFIALGLHKLADPIAFMKAIREYHMVAPERFVVVNAIAALLPWLEVLLGLLLVLGIAVRGSALALAILLIVFTTAIVLRAHAIQTLQGIAFCDVAFDCGCGTGVERVCTKVPENLLLLGLALLLAIRGAARFCLKPRLV